MNHAAIKAEILQPSLEYGSVVFRKDNGAFGVKTSFGMTDARLAVSCLVQPQPDDRVLLSIDLEGIAYILSVLESGTEQGTGTELVFEGDVSLHAKNGSLQFMADASLNLCGGESVDVATDRLTVNAHKGEAAISRLTFLGRTLTSQVKRIVAVAKTVEQNFRRLTQRMESTERYVEDHEEIQTGSTRYLVADTLTTHAGNTLNISEELHTMQAEQIHMG